MERGVALPEAICNDPTVLGAVPWADLEGLSVAAAATSVGAALTSAAADSFPMADLTFPTSARSRAATPLSPSTEEAVTLIHSAAVRCD